MLATGAPAAMVLLIAHGPLPGWHCKHPWPLLESLSFSHLSGPSFHPFSSSNLSVQPLSPTTQPKYLIQRLSLICQFSLPPQALLTVQILLTIYHSRLSSVQTLSPVFQSSLWSNLSGQLACRLFSLSLSSASLSLSSESSLCSQTSLCSVSG